MPAPTALTFHYDKSPHFRNVYADGVHGGFAPTGDVLNIAFWSTRKPLPDAVTHTFIPGESETMGSLGPEVSRQVKDGMLREVEAIVTMPASTSVDFLAWLAKQLQARGVPVVDLVRNALEETDSPAGGGAE